MGPYLSFSVVFLIALMELQSGKNTYYPKLKTNVCVRPGQIQF